MLKPKITILTVNYNSADFIELMLYALSKLTKNTYQIFIADSANTRKDDYKRLQRIIKGYKEL